MNCRQPVVSHGKFLVLVVAAILAGGGVASGPVGAQTLSLGSVTALPEDTVELPLTLTTDDPINELVVHISFPSARLHLLEVFLDGGVLEDLELELDDVELGAGEITAHWVLDDSDPFDLTIEAGTDLLIATLRFEVEELLLPGTETLVEFTTDVMPVEVVNEVFVDGDPVTPTTIDGVVRISDENMLLVENQFAVTGDEDRHLEITGYNVDSIQGYSVALTYDPTRMDVTDFIVAEDLELFVDIEFSQAEIDNDTGEATLGALFDAVPPFDDQSLAAAGFVLPFAYLVYNVPEVVEPAFVDVVLVEEGLGSPVIENLFVIDFLSVLPTLVDGVVEIAALPLFVRGEANGDFRLDLGDPIFQLAVMFRELPGPECRKSFDGNDDGIVTVADPVYVLSYLFSEGPEPPAPFPEPGLDPTPDDIECEPTHP